MGSGRKMISHDMYVKAALALHPNIEVIGMYSKSKTKILHRCKIDKHEWMASPNHILSGRGCPVCAKHIIGKAPEYKNSIWASEYKNYFSKYLTENQMKTIMPNSHQLLDIICPDCGKRKKISPNTLLLRGLSCVCGDGVSFPNKFVYSVLKQLNLSIITEYSPEWACGKRYDIYLPQYNIIIENHGEQHYYENMNWQLTLADQQLNDKLKYEMALSNNISSYVILDCRKSELSWIKNSIIKSKLPVLLNFSAEDINWTKAHEYALSNLIKYAAELFENGLNITQIATKMGKNQITIRGWLKKANQVGWCKYAPQKFYQYTPKNVYCIELNQIFMSIKNASKITNTDASHITDCCNKRRKSAGKHSITEEKLHWLFIEDAIKLNYITAETIQNEC